MRDIVFFLENDVMEVYEEQPEKVFYSTLEQWSQTSLLTRQDDIVFGGSCLAS